MKTKNCTNCKKPRMKLIKEKVPSDPSSKDSPLVEARYYKCQACGESWMPANEIENLSAAKTKANWQTLSPAEIKEIREAFGFATKTKAAQFLGLNYKAFSKSENEYNPLNYSTDLLLRLVAFSRANYNFVQQLHEKKFNYEPTDYELVCAKRDLKWNFKLSSEYKDISVHLEQLHPMRTMATSTYSSFVAEGDPYETCSI
jgi:DNA-binding transcriptional regulator YiaG